MKIDKTLEGSLSRRCFLKNTGLVAATAGITLAASGVLDFGAKAEAAKGSSSALPWPYKKFSAAEIKEVGNIAHDNWFKGFCSYAALSGVVTVLRKKVGGPYISFPMEVAQFAHGGTSGWGGTCGTLIGAGIPFLLIEYWFFA